MPRIEILVGMIGSSKSTYARKRAAEGALVVCHDDLTAMLHGEYRYEAGLRDCYRVMEQSLAWVALNHGKDVVVDRTHLSAEARQRWIKWARHYDDLNTFDGRGPHTPVVAVTFRVESPHVHAMRRWVDDPRGRDFPEWLGVAEHHHTQHQAEPLELAEGFAAIIPGDQAS